MNIPYIIRTSTWKTPELRESAAKLVEIILQECATAPESPAKEQPGDDVQTTINRSLYAAPRDKGATFNRSGTGNVSHLDVSPPAVAAPDVAATLKRLHAMAVVLGANYYNIPELRALLCEAATMIEKLVQSWAPMSERLPYFTKEGNDPPVLIYSPKLAADAGFPGHAVIVSNPEYVANGNAAKYGYTHWLHIPPPPERP